MGMTNGSGKTCLKCGYERTGGDKAPPGDCPRCGAVYAKVEESMRAEAAAHARDALPARTAAFQARAAFQAQRAKAPLETKRKPADRLKNEARFVYGLYSVAPIAFPTMLMGVMAAYSMRASAKGTWLESHCEWQIDTFWGAAKASFVVAVAGLVGMMVSLVKSGGEYLGLALAVLAVYATLGAFVLVGVWVLVRCAKGWGRLRKEEPVA